MSSDEYPRITSQLTDITTNTYVTTTTKVEAFKLQTCTHISTHLNHVLYIYASYIFYNSTATTKTRRTAAKNRWKVRNCWKQVWYFARHTGKKTLLYGWQIAPLRLCGEIGWNYFHTHFQTVHIHTCAQFISIFML